MRETTPFEIYVVSHTHWDREWYLPLARFRQRLVALIDELLDDPPGRAAFLLDGQAILLDDYLTVRPERAANLRELLKRGALEAGPWFVLADELLPSGEALVRNLLAGIRTVRAHGGEPLPVLYCPDSFGHPADLPTLAEGFGFPLIILWRGLGGPAWPGGDAFRWRAPSGAYVLVHHLPPAGYEYGANLPSDADQARARWNRLKEVLAPRARTNALLVLNGADHHARQTSLRDAIEALADVARPDRVRASGLGEFAAAFVERASAINELPKIEGELRCSPGYAWTVSGTWSARAYQKRRNSSVERLLTREAEPWSVIASARGGRPRGPLLRTAWRTLLECHPHDTLCGCSADEVAMAADQRFAFAETEARGIVNDALLDLVGHDSGKAHDAPHRWRPLLLVRNPVPRARGGVAEVEVVRLVTPEPVGPGSAGVIVNDRELPPPAIDEGRVPLQVLSRSVRSGRIESSRHYPHNYRIEVARCIAWVDDVPGYGLLPLPISTSESHLTTSPPSPIQATGTWLDNGLIRVGIGDEGDVQLESLTHGTTWARLIRFEDVGDAGDLYTHSSVGDPIKQSRVVATRFKRTGPLRGELRVRFALELPVGATRAGRSSQLLTQDVDVALRLDAGSPFVRLRVKGVNGIRDHRLRVIFATGIAGGTTVADAMFGPVLREPTPQPNGTERMELIPSTAPLARWVSRHDDTRGLTVISDGLAEYESMSDGGIAVTLLRAVGALSRNDLPERPGHAGWPTQTPGAQALGPYRARFALLPHGPRHDAILDDIERAADDALLPLRGTTVSSAITQPLRLSGLSLDGEGLRFLACKESEDGLWAVLRCANITGRAASGSWRCGWQVREARQSRLDEQPGDPVGTRDSVIPISLGPYEVGTVLVR
jgi:alpha-mannosidase